MAPKSPNARLNCLSCIPYVVLGECCSDALSSNNATTHLDPHEQVPGSHQSKIEEGKQGQIIGSLHLLVPARIVL